jgi:hypothetical protein
MSMNAPLLVANPNLGEDLAVRVPCAPGPDRSVESSRLRLALAKDEPAGMLGN